MKDAIVADVSVLANMICKRNGDDVTHLGFYTYRDKGPVGWVITRLCVSSISGYGSLSQSYHVHYTLGAVRQPDRFSVFHRETWVHIEWS